MSLTEALVLPRHALAGNFPCVERNFARGLFDD